MKVWDGHGSGRIGFDASEVNAPYLGHIVENRLTLQSLLQCAENLSGR
jgi:2-octaprenylphenol hydroxylase